MIMSTGICPNISCCRCRCRSN